MPASAPNPLSLVLVALMKGVMDRENELTRWQSLLDLQTRVRDHVAVLGLELILDEAEGYAYLRQRPIRDGEEELPRLVPRRQLGYQVSLLLALLRKKMAEFDATSGESRLILSRDEIVEMMRLFLPDTTNQARLMDRVDTHINRIMEMGFLRRDAVARLVGIEGGVVSGVFNLESSGVEAPDWRPRHDQHYHEVRLFAAYSRDGCASFRRLV